MNPNDFVNLCRICLESKENDIKVPIFEKSENKDSLSIAEKINFCSGIKIIKNEIMPDKICLKCLKYLNTSFSFRYLCQRSDDILQNLFAKKQTDTSSKIFIRLSNGLLVKPADFVKLKSSSSKVNKKNLLQCIKSKNYTLIQKNDENVLVKNEITENDNTENDFEDNSMETTQNNEENTCTNTLNDRDFDSESDGTSNWDDLHLQKFEPKTTPKEFIDEKYRYICEKCGSIFSVKSSLTMHMIKTHGQPDYDCKTCGKNFFTRYALNNHSLRHTGIRKYKCSICGKRYYEKKDLIRHEATHSDGKHECKYCGKKFAYSHGLKKHELIHEGIKPFKCEVCLKSFRQHHHLKQHLNSIQHSDAVAKSTLYDIPT